MTLKELESENLELRKLLAFTIAGDALYGDDGELQDNRVRPFIDFKRDPVELIQEKLFARVLGSDVP
jgi:hypothetical protein